MNHLSHFKNSLSDLLSLFYPHLCMACDDHLRSGEDVICLSCQYFLPKTNFHLEKDNPVEKHFWGRVPIEGAAAFYYFNKQSKVQRLLHQLKYQGKKEVGIKLGNLYGDELKRSERYSDIDIIIPVPLHPKKQRKRGYNQSEMFAKGLSESMNVPFSAEILLRTADSQTQTKKTRMQRWQNVESIFTIRHPELIKGKTILLVDDVITTGSTLEACVLALQQVGDVKVKIATIAAAQ